MVLILVVSLLIIVAPFFSAKDRGLVMLPHLNVPSPEENLRVKKSNLVLILKELDFDFETGKLSKEDYQELRKKYEDDTLKVMKELDALQVVWQVAQEKLTSELEAKGIDVQ